AAGAAAPVGLDDRRLRQLVSGPARQQHHAVARIHLRLPASDQAIRPGRLSRDHPAGSAGAGRRVPRGERSMTDIAGKVAVVTGAGSGIGRSLALQLAKGGARLALSDMDTLGLAETVRQAEQLGAEVHS